jgi:hypothetical protein
MTCIVDSGKYPRRRSGEHWHLFGAALFWVAFSSIASGQSAVQRDQQALTILLQTIAAGGGQNMITSIQDLTETGTATFNLDSEVRASITIKGRGLQLIRIDADLPEGRRSTVVNALGGLLREADGQLRTINRQSIANLRNITFPYLPLIVAMQDSSAKIIYGGLVTHDGAPAYDVRIEKAHASEQGSPRQRGSHPRDFYIDPKSLLVMAISDQIRGPSDPQDAGIPHEVLYSNYQSQNGIAMPMTISETVRGVTGVSMELTQVTFNSGLTDSDFSEQ